MNKNKPSGRPLFVFILASISLLGLTACGPGDSETDSEKTAASEPDTSQMESSEDDVTILEMPIAAHFRTPGGERIIIEPGSYEVALDGLTLWLLPLDDRPEVQVSVEELTHDENTDSPDVIAYSGVTDEDQDILEIVVLLPSGQYYSAMGSISGVSPRGVLKRAKNRQAMRQENRANRQKNRAIRQENRRKQGVLASTKENLQNRRDTFQENRANRQDTRAKNRKDRRNQFGIGGNTIPEYRAGKGAFSRFDHNADGQAMKNTYLLSYLSTLVYPDYLVEIDGGTAIGVCNADPCKETIASMHRKGNDNFNSGNALFIKKYAELTQQLFVGQAKYTWLHGYENRAVIYQNESNLNYDPEAMVISTDDAIFVVFRGTDVLDGAGTWEEWISTNINSFPKQPGNNLPGMVQTGFWDSLRAPAKSYKLEYDREYVKPPAKFGQEFRVMLRDQIMKYGGKSKPVWITGHSLGGAHAQLFAAFLTEFGVEARGVYVFESPQVGNPIFKQFLDETFENRLQRFEFKTDPVTRLPNRFARPGARVWARNVNLVTFDAFESRIGRPPVIKAVQIGESLCYHYPHWALVAAYNQLTPADQAVMPSHLGSPWTEPLTLSNKGGFLGCNIANIRLGNGQS